MKKKILALVLTLVVVLSGLQMPHVHAEGEGDAAYLEFKEALTAANAKGKNTIVEVPAGRVVVPAGEELVVAKGVILVIPYADVTFNYKDLESFNPYKDAGTVTKNKYSELVFSAGSSLTIQDKGKVYVTAETGMNGNSVNVVTGGYGQIVTEAGSSIIVEEGGLFNNYGYVTGAGSLSTEYGATVTDLFSIINFKGGTHLGATVGGENGSSNTFPLNEFSTGNIQINSTYAEGSCLNGSITLYAEDKVNRSDFLIIGENADYEQGLFVPVNDGCIIKKTTVPSTNDNVLNKEKFQFVGDVNMGSSAMEIQIKGIMLQLSTSNFMFPIPGNTTIEVVSGTTTVENGYKFMPGSKMFVREGATLNVIAKGESASLGKFAVLDEASRKECTGYLAFYNNANFAAVDSTVTPAYSSGKTDAELIVNGKLEISTAAKVAGKITVCGDGKVDSMLALEAPVEFWTFETLEASANATDYKTEATAKLKPVTNTVDWANAFQEHTWGESQVVGDGKCEQECTMKHTCTTCGVSEEYKEVLQHKYETVVTEPTCTEEGNTAKTCPLCGDSVVSDIVEPLGHSFTKYTSNGDADCDTDGTKTSTCDNGCGEKNTITDAGSALGHDYESVVTAPTCTEGGYTTHTCKVCGHKEVNSPTASFGGHDYTSWVETTAPTCTEAGKEERGCTRCDFVEEREVEALGHDYKSVVTAPTCTEGGYTTYTCSVCGDTYKDDETEAKGHDYEAVVTEPTCTEGGYTTFTCSVCGDTYVGDETEALGHNLATETIVKEATCTEDGEKHGECTRCDYFVTVVIPAKGHTLSEWEVTEEATCTEIGNKTRGCANCDYTEEEVIPAKGHDYKEEVTAPTCTGKGYTTYTCTRCQDTYKDDYVDAKGHDYEAVVTEPTCTEGGYTTYTCSVCGDTYKDDETAALGHDYEAVVTEPTCTEKGYTTYTCTVCGDTYKDDYVDALGHNFVKADKKVALKDAATCITKAVYYESCERCDALNKEVTFEFGEALGHDYKAVVTAPTCTEGGYTTYTCGLCGDTYKDDETAALGHDHKAVVTAPTCTEGGYTTYTCACGDTYKDDETAALGHDYKAVVTEPTCTEEGYTTHTCTRCSDAYKDTTVEKLGHTFETYVSDNNAKCEEDGTKTAKCVRCDVTDTVADPGSATGHNYVGVACDKCGDKLVVADKVENVDTSKPVDKVTPVVKQEAADKTAAEITEVVDAILKGEVTEEIKAAVSEEVIAAVKEEIAAGNKITTEIVATIYADGVAETLVAEDVASIKAALAEKEFVAQYFDIQIIIKSLTPAGGEKELGTLNELGEEITVTIAIPKSLNVKGREFFVLRAHDGKVDKLATTKNADGTISFKTDRFSTYALAYSDKAATPTAPVTADSNMVVGYALASVVALAAILFTMKKKAFAR